MQAEEHQKFSYTKELWKYSKSFQSFILYTQRSIKKTYLFSQLGFKFMLLSIYWKYEILYIVSQPFSWKEKSQDNIFCEILLNLASIYAKIRVICFGTLEFHEYFVG